MRLAAEVAATRTQVRRCLADLPPDALVLVALSGGPDSTALAAATAFACRDRRAPGAITVDHRLQLGSAERAAAVAGWARGAGFEPAAAVTVAVRRAGRGLEDAARQARYAALDEAARRHGAAVVLLGHTLDDQAETVLLRLARGSGARALAGMPQVRGGYRRPFLGLSRAVTEAACVAQGLDFWRDPQNADPAFARARVRAGVVPALVAALGPGAVRGLARSAALLRDDAEALDDWAGQALAACGAGAAALAVPALAVLPAAVRRRVLRLAALRAGCPAGALTAGHVGELDRLVGDWHGQGPIALPGGVAAERACARLHFYGRAVAHRDHERATAGGTGDATVPRGRQSAVRAAP